MKFNFSRSVAPILLCLFALATAGFATSVKTNPLNQPNGLAVDAQGNLWVANTGDNDVIVFKPSYAQMTTETIKAGINHPVGVAVDPIGNLWVANYDQGNGGLQGSITEYTAGVQDDPVITDGVSFPEGLAIDGAGNIWVQNGDNNITVYAQPVLTHVGVPTLVQTFGLAGPIYGIAVSQGTIGWGTASTVLFGSTTTAIGSNNPEGLVARTESPSEDMPLAMATDASGNFYIANYNGQINVLHPNSTQTTLVDLMFSPAGIAIDNVRGRVYISNFNGNSIAVYSTAGVLLHTIE
jgi:DNA-binding beta-propeller fold protein YncE